MIKIELNKQRMFMCRIVIVSLLFLVISNFGSAQADSIVLKYKDFVDNIYQYHPIAEKADLKVKMAAAESMAAKGLLDPELYSNWDQKRFDDKQYYRRYNATLKIPTILGIDVVGGYENTEGVFLNPENKTDNYGLWHLGIEANLIQGLIVNERKIAKEQAVVFQNIAENEQQIMLNELIYSASVAYLQWQRYYHFEKVIDNNIELSKVYYENTVELFELGEKTVMDTLESYIVFQDAIILQQKNNAYLIKSRQNIEYYLWFDNRPISLQNNTVPEDYQRPIFDAEYNPDINNLVNELPQILASINKQSFLELDQKMKREKLKPKLKLKYNPLLSTSSNSIAPNLSVSDFKWGFQFSFPLLLRSERAGVRKGEIKLMEVELDINDKRNSLRNKLENSILQRQILESQMLILEKNVAGYKTLLDGENEKFKFGESSVFLVNKRQEKYRNGQLKLIDLNISIQSEILNYLYLSSNLL